MNGIAKPDAPPVQAYVICEYDFYGDINEAISLRTTSDASRASMPSSGNESASLDQKEYV